MVDCLLWLIALAMTVAPTVDTPTIREVTSPAGPGSAQPNLFVSADGRLFLSWIDPERGRSRLRFASREGGTWSKVRTIAEGDNWFVNSADFPSLVALPDGTLAAHWLVKSGPGTYSYDVNVALSTNKGNTWTRAVVPHRDGTLTEHGFVSMFPSREGKVGLVWLDGRNMKSQHGHGSSADEMTLRYTTIDRNARLGEDGLVDARVCECCQTSTATTSDGVVVVYRDRSPTEVRDISIVRFTGGRWSEPRTVNADGWEIHGCPVNGPSVAAYGRRVAVAWFTAAKNTPRVNVAFSSDSGVSFSKPIQVDDGSPVGRVDVVTLADGSAMVSWLERINPGAEIRVRRVTPDGLKDKSITIATSSAARASGFPRMKRVGNEIFLAWTDASSPTRVRVAALNLRASGIATVR